MKPRRPLLLFAALLAAALWFAVVFVLPVVALRELGDD